MDALSRIRQDRRRDVWTAPSHFKVVMSALLAGKHVITEKPFAMTVDEGGELCSLAASRGLTPWPVHNSTRDQYARRTHGSRPAAWVRSVRCGALQLSNPRRRLPDWYDDLPLGLFFDESPHLLYLLRHFAGGDLALDSVSIVPPTMLGANTPAQITAQYGSVPATLTSTSRPQCRSGRSSCSAKRGWRRSTCSATSRFPFRTTDATQRTGPENVRARTLGHRVGYPRSGPGHLVCGKLLYGNDEVFAACRRGRYRNRRHGDPGRCACRARGPTRSRGGGARVNQLDERLLRVLGPVLRWRYVIVAAVALLSCLQHISGTGRDWFYFVEGSELLFGRHHSVFAQAGRPPLLTLTMPICRSGR